MRDGLAVTTGIKICGLDSVANAQAALDAGVQALGLNFVPGSPRELALNRAAEIATMATGRAPLVGLFANASDALIGTVLEAVRLDWLQFHGDEPHAACDRWDLPYLKALPASSGVVAAARNFLNARGWLVDAVSKEGFGGTGERFDWSLWPDAAARKRAAGAGGQWFLAGGLTPENVGAAIVELRPDWVDVSSGAEGRVRGRKDPARIRAFVAAVRQADEELAQSR
jgi:phosphoribosylanthranilate isomerase